MIVSLAFILLMWARYALMAVNNQQCPSDVQQCLAMHEFQNTYDAIKGKIMELNSMALQLKSGLDDAIQLSCGNIGQVGSHEVYKTTYCDFEDGNDCGIINIVGDDGDWELQNVQYPDHSTGTKTGHTIRSMYGYDYGPSYLSRVQSKTFPAARAYCIRFFYMVEAADATSGQFNVYLQVNGKLGVPIFTQTSISAHRWTLGEISPDSEYLGSPFEIVFEQNRLNQYLYIDDLMVYNAPCYTSGIKRPICPQSSIARSADGYKSCYTFHIEALSYFDALRACKNSWPLSSLVNIESAAEQQFIVQMISNSSVIKKAADFGLWTNGNDIDTENSYVWMTGVYPTKINYTNWHPGQPNNIGANQDCLLLQYPHSNYEWGDVPCSERHSFICEMNYDIKSSSFQAQFPSVVVG